MWDWLLSNQTRLGGDFGSHEKTHTNHGIHGVHGKKKNHRGVGTKDWPYEPPAERSGCCWFGRSAPPDFLLRGSL